MSDKDNGGAAFPHGEVINNSMIYEGECGMSLRDWFAGKALPALISASPGMKLGTSSLDNNETLAIVAYALADAMLKARES